MQTTDQTTQQDFVASFSLQRQRLLHHAGSILGGETAQTNPESLARLSQTLLTSLELLKVAEDELREERRTNAMRSTVQERHIAHFSALFDLAPVPLLLTTADTTIREVNRAGAKFLGRDAYSLGGLQLSNMVPQAQRNAFREQLGHVLEIGAVAAWSFTLELQRSLPCVVSATVELINDEAVGTRALYWSLRAMTP